MRLATLCLIRGGGPEGTWSHRGLRQGAGWVRHRWPEPVGGRGSRRGAGRSLGPELALELHKAPDAGAVGAEVWLDLGGQLTDGDQVDAEQLRALLQWRCDGPAQVRVVPGSHRTRVPNISSRPNRESCLLQQWRSTSLWGAAEPRTGGTWGQRRTAGDNESRGQRPVLSRSPGTRNRWTAFHTARAALLGSDSGASRPCADGRLERRLLRVFRNYADLLLSLIITR